jgi:hypothetical protein
VGTCHNVSQPTTNYWSTGRAKQALANQRGLRQRQRPLDRAPLPTADKDADYIALVSQSELLLLLDSVWSAHGSSDPPSSNAANRIRKLSLRPLGSSPPTLAALRPAHSHPTAEHGGPLSHTQARPMRPELRRHSSGTYVIVSPNTETNIPHD